MTDKISPSSLNAPGSLTTEASTIPLSVQENRLLLLSNQARDHIKVVVEHVLIHEQDTPMAKAVWTWIVTLGTLAWDVSGSAISLLAMREFRAGKILSRALVDYGVRLEYYAHKPDKALEDFINAPNCLRKFIRPGESLYQNEPDWPSLQQFLAGDDSLIRRQTRQMMERNLAAVEEPARVSQLIAYAYDREYGIGSALVHGNQGCMWDVFGDLTGQAKHHQWQSRGVHLQTLALDIAQGLLGVARGLAIITQQTEEYERLFHEMQTVLKATPVSA